MGRGTFTVKWRETLEFSLSREVALCVVPDRIQHERLAEEHLDFVVRPILCWQRLQEHNDALWFPKRHKKWNNRTTIRYLKVHLTELVAPPGEKRRTNVEVKLRKGIRTLGL